MVGAYLNYLEGAEKLFGVERATPGDAVARLRTLEQRHDPDCLFGYGVDLTG
jgi:hypothetical protein